MPIDSAKLSCLPCTSASLFDSNRAGRTPATIGEIVKPFDLDAAKRGEAFEYLSIIIGRWCKASWIGIDRKGHVHGEFQSESSSWNKFCVAPAGFTSLRMTPRLVTIAIEIWHNETHGYSSCVIHEDGLKNSICLLGKKLHTIPYFAPEAAKYS